MTRNIASVLMLLAIGGVSPAGAADGSWSADSAGDWSDPSKWSGETVAGGADHTARFVMNITAGRAVAVDSPVTIGHLVFDDTGSSGDSIWTIAGPEALTLECTTGMPTITTVSWGNTISAALAGTNGLRISSVNALILSGANSYTGVTELAGGTTAVGHNQAFGNSALSLQGGTLWAGVDRTLGNAVTLDADSYFGYVSGSSYPGDITFSRQLELRGNHALVHNGNIDGNYPQPTRFSAGVGDGGNGYNLIIKTSGTNRDGFILGSGSTYTGTTVVHGAMLRLHGTLTTTAGIQANRGGNFQMYWDSAGTDNRLGNAVPVYMRGGQMQAYIYSGGADFDATETVGSVHLEYANSTLSIHAVRAHGTMTITNLTRASGATVYFSRSGASQSNSGGGYGYGRLKITGQAAGFMGGGVIARRSEYVAAVLQDSGYDFAWYDTGTAVLSGVLPLATQVARSDQVEGASSADHVKATNTQTTLTGNTAIQSLCVTNGCDNDLGGYTLDIVSGGLLNRGGAYTLSNGMLTSSGGTLFLYNYGTGMTNSAVISNPAASVSTVGSQTLSGNNPFGGSLYVNSGTLTLTGSNTGVSEATVVPGATLSVQHPEAITRPVRLNLLFDGEEYGKCSLGTNIMVQTLALGGAEQVRGDYTAASHPLYFTGTGILTVVPPALGTVFRFQ